MEIMRRGLGIERPGGALGISRNVRDTEVVEHRLDSEKSTTKKGDTDVSVVLSNLCVLDRSILTELITVIISRVHQAI